VPKTDVVFGPLYDNPNYDCELPGGGKGDTSFVDFVSGSVAEGEQITSISVDGKKIGDSSLNFPAGTHTYTYTVTNLNSTTDPKETAEISGSFTIKRCDTTPTPTPTPTPQPTSTPTPTPTPTSSPTPAVIPATVTASFTGELINNVPTVKYTLTYDAGTEGAGNVIIAITDAKVTTVHFDGSGIQTGSFPYRCGDATFFLAIQGHDTVEGVPYPVTIPCAVDNSGDGTSAGTGGSTTNPMSGGSTTITNAATKELPATGLNSAVTGVVAAAAAGLLLLGLLTAVAARRMRRTVIR